MTDRLAAKPGGDQEQDLDFPSGQMGGTAIASPERQAVAMPLHRPVASDAAAPL
jgi:hypothetical protein